MCLQTVLRNREKKSQRDSGKKNDCFGNTESRKVGKQVLPEFLKHFRINRVIWLIFINFRQNRRPFCVDELTLFDYNSTKIMNTIA